MNAPFVAQRYRLDDTAVVDLNTARRYAERLVRGHYENFTVASWFLPRSLRPHFNAIYAYCRVSDDLADEVVDGAESLARLAAWRTQLADMYAGQPRHWVFVALAETVREFVIPCEPFERLLDAFERDRSQTRYPTFDDLCTYCACSADPVGHLVLYLGNYRDHERQKLSDRICTGLQLANFWQDVARDWDKGRVYVPQEDLVRFGVSEGDVAQRRATPAFRELMRFECNRTARLFGEGEPLLRMLDVRLRRDVTLFVAGGRSILQCIADQDYDTLSSRPTLSRWNKVGLMLRVMVGQQPWQ